MPALLPVLAVLLASCHDVPEYADNPRGNFEALWAILDEHYCFFEYKDVDWQAVRTEYSRKIDDRMTDEELFRVCSDMLMELKDGHTNLSSPFDVSRYWIWEQYPANYDDRLLAVSRYPYYLKQRIRGRSGHLSNQQAAELLADVASERLRYVVPIHLSHECNTIDLALYELQQAAGQLASHPEVMAPVYPSPLLEI